MKRRDILPALGSAFVVARTGSPAAQPQVRRKVVILLGAANSGVPAFEAGLARLGWRNGQTVDLLVLSADGDTARIAGLVRDAIASTPDVIVSSTNPMHVALREATRTIPVVVVASSDPVSLGLTDTISRPSRNFTGFPTFTADLTGKRLELLREVQPGGRKVALLLNPTNPAFPGVREAARVAAASSGWEVLIAGLQKADDVLPAIAAARDAGADAMIVVPDPLVRNRIRVVLQRAIDLRLPTLSFYREDLPEGAVLVHGLDVGEAWRDAATYVDRILNGARPAELPFVLPARIFLGVNLKSAGALGLTVPPSLLARADEVIE